MEELLQRTKEAVEAIQQAQHPGMPPEAVEVAVRLATNAIYVSAICERLEALTAAVERVGDAAEESVRICPRCDGDGYVHGTRCIRCDGSGTRE